MKICYVPKNFAPSSLAIIHNANAIIEVYAAQGYELTLRQLYYQFVSRDLIANRQSEYDRLGSVINDARQAAVERETQHREAISEVVESLRPIPLCDRFGVFACSLGHFPRGGVHFGPPPFL